MGVYLSDFRLNVSSERSDGREGQIEKECDPVGFPAGILNGIEKV